MTRATSSSRGRLADVPHPGSAVQIRWARSSPLRFDGVVGWATALSPGSSGGPRGSESIGGRAVVGEGDRHLGESVAQVALDGARADAEHLGDVVDLEVVVVAQHEAGAFARGELAKLLVEVEPRVGRGGGRRQLVGDVFEGRDAAPAGALASGVEEAVEDRAAHVGLGALDA